MMTTEMASNVGHDVHIKDVTMAFGPVTAVDQVNVHIPAGTFFSFLGPSGCGKTTLLKLVSGFLEPTRGEILINGINMKGVGPNKRPTAMIFQNLALFPLMTVAENIAFGLDVMGMEKRQKKSRVEALLELVDLPHAGNLRVTDLSGGQRQRVAIARALAVEPSVLLLDEPLSALDLKLRKHMRTELRQIQQKTDVTFIYITHDQGEALTMSDRVGVMSQSGVLEQVGTPREIYDHPRTAFVASFVGENNAIPVTMAENKREGCMVESKLGTLSCQNPLNIESGYSATAFVRPETIALVNGSGSYGNQLRCRILSQRFEGAFMTMELTADDGTLLTLRQSNNGRQPPLEKGDSAAITFSPEHTMVLR